MALAEESQHTGGPHLSEKGCGPYLRHLIGWLEARAKKLEGLLAKLNEEEDEEDVQTKTEK